MRWFGKGRQPDLWDIDAQESLGDLEAAQKIREFCYAASDIARNVGSGFGGPAEKERCERAAKAAMRTALRIADDLVRDAALRRIIDLCVTANNLKAAEMLLRAIQAISIREEVLNDNPILRR
jgi:uncharacterized protein (UPF0147 family)